MKSLRVRSHISSMSDVECHADPPNGTTAIYTSPAEAAQLVVAIGQPVYIDVVAWSAAGAESIGLGERYQEDPDVSVLQRIRVLAEDLDRVP